MTKTDAKQRPRVYLAGASAPEQAGRVLAWAERLTEAGAQVASTWTAHVAMAGEGNPRDATRKQRLTWSMGDLSELRTSTVMWLLVPPVEVPTRGAWFEVGYAYSAGIPVVLSGDTRQSVFCVLGDEYQDDEDAFGMVLVRLGLVIE